MTKPRITTTEKAISIGDTPSSLKASIGANIRMETYTQIFGS
jgi:hypothetical protein